VRGWLLDTNVISELRKARADSGVVAFVEAQPAELLYVSEITFGEIRYGIEQIADPTRRANLNLWLDRSIRPLFANRVLSITEGVIVRWKMMVVAGQKHGHTFGQPDLFIAASAALEDLVVVSRDIAHFVAADVPVFDPWAGILHARRKTFAIESPATVEAVIAASKGRRR
jgi:hypothetical protein